MQTQSEIIATAQNDAERGLALLIVSALQLEMPAASIDPTLPLFGEGLGLDSIDALELALAISRAYGFELRSDDQRNQRIFASLRSLAEHVEANLNRLMAPGHPLLDRPDAGTLFHRSGGPVSGAAFLADAHALAAMVPPGQYLINLCETRYAFAVGIAAGLILRRTSLLNADPAGLDSLALSHPGAILSDTPSMLAGAAMPVVAVRSDGSRSTVGSGAVNPDIPADHLAAIVFTSGSTGAPVSHPKRWGELVARSRAAAHQFGLSGGVIVAMVPPQHMYGFETSILLPFHAPVASWCGASFFPADIHALPPCPAPRILVTTPLQLRTLLHSGLDLPIEHCISATAPLDPALAAGVEARFDVSVHEIFGATECGSIASRRTTAGIDWTLYPGVRLRFEEAGTTVLAEAAPPVALADILEPSAMGFRLLGRRADVVKLAGRRASLPGLNQALAGLPGVQDGAFVLPDDVEHRSTARLVAIVVAPGRSDSAILADLRRVIDPAFLPRRVIRVEALPRNAMGKLPRQALLDLVAGDR